MVHPHKARAIQLGGSPVKKLDEKLKLCRPWRSHIWEGMSPTNSLSATLKSSNFVIFPMVIGRLPVRRLELTSKTVSSVRRPMLSGMQPVSWLLRKTNSLGEHGTNGGWYTSCEIIVSQDNDWGYRLRNGWRNGRGELIIIDKNGINVGVSEQGGREVSIKGIESNVKVSQLG